jgi:hypothetical protein
MGCREAEPGITSRTEARPTIVVVAENLAGRPFRSSHAFPSDRIVARAVPWSSGWRNPNPKGTPIEALFDECWDMEGT